MDLNDVSDQIMGAFGVFGPWFLTAAGIVVIAYITHFTKRDCRDKIKERAEDSANRARKM